MRKVLFLALLGFLGCDKLARNADTAPGAKPAGAERTAEKKDVKKPAEDPEYTKSYEAAKAHAVSEFPALGVAGSPFNVTFVTRANKWKETNAQELRSADWPYTLALKVNAEQLKAKADLYKPGAVLTVNDLQALKPPPAGACVSGHITQASGGPTAVLILDNSLKCEISDPAANTGSGEVSWVREGNLLVLKSKPVNSLQSNVIKSFAIGQRITCEGVFAPAGSTKKLIGVIKH